MNRRRRNRPEPRSPTSNPFPLPNFRGMKKTCLSFAVGALLLAGVPGLLFCFQVRTTEVAVVTTFGRYSRDAEAGSLPAAAAHSGGVYKFDRRLPEL